MPFSTSEHVRQTTYNNPLLVVRAKVETYLRKAFRTLISDQLLHHWQRTHLHISSYFCKFAKNHAVKNWFET